MQSTRPPVIGGSGAAWSGGRTPHSWFGEGEAGEDALGPGLVEEEGLCGADPPQQPQVLQDLIKDQVWGLVLLCTSGAIEHIKYFLLLYFPEKEDD